MGNIEKTPLQNCVFIDSDGNRIGCTAKILDISLDPIPDSIMNEKIPRLQAVKEFHATFEHPRYSFRGLVRMLGLRIALQFKLRQIFQRRKE